VRGPQDDTAAADGTLRRPEVLRSYVDRILVEKKWRAFTSSFMSQWFRDEQFIQSSDELRYPLSRNAAWPQRQPEPEEPETSNSRIGPVASGCESLAKV
jgi:hypothetical protein